MTRELGSGVIAGFTFGLLLVLPPLVPGVVFGVFVFPLDEEEPPLSPRPPPPPAPPPKILDHKGLKPPPMPFRPFRFELEEDDELEDAV